MTLSRRHLIGAALPLALPALARAAERPRVLRITYVAAPFNVPSIVMRAKGYLGEAFAPFGLTVESPEITSGAQQVQAMAAGEVHIASVLGGASAILGRANGVDVKVAAVYSRTSQAYQILTRSGGPASVAALRGKNVGGPKGTTLHQLLAAALAREGMALNDVNHLGMDLPTARAALLAGQIDAATLAGNNALAVEAAGGRILASGEGLIAPTTVIGVRGDFLRDHPDLVSAYLAAHRRALGFLRTDTEEALRIAAEDQRISLADARRMLPWYDFTLRLTDRDVANMGEEQRFMVSAGMLQRTVDIGAELIAPSARELQ